MERGRVETVTLVKIKSFVAVDVNQWFLFETNSLGEKPCVIRSGRDSYRLCPWAGALVRKSCKIMVKKLRLKSKLEQLGQRARLFSTSVKRSNLPPYRLITLCEYHK